MDWIEDSRACLVVAEIMLVEIEDMIQQSIRDEHITPYIMFQCFEPIPYKG